MNVVPIGEGTKRPCCGNPFDGSVLNSCGARPTRVVTGYNVELRGMVLLTCCDRHLFGVQQFLLDTAGMVAGVDVFGIAALERIVAASLDEFGDAFVLERGTEAVG